MTEGQHLQHVLDTVMKPMNAAIAERATKPYVPPNYYITEVEEENEDICDAVRRAFRATVVTRKRPPHLHPKECPEIESECDAVVVSVTEGYFLDGVDMPRVIHVTAGDAPLQIEAEFVFAFDMKKCGNKVAMTFERR